jgi:hypothetical protein
VSVEYPDLTDYLAVAAEVTGIDVKTVTNATNLGLADFRASCAVRKLRGRGVLSRLLRQSSRALGTTSKEPPTSRWKQAGGLGDPQDVHRDELVALGRLPFH